MGQITSGIGLISGINTADLISQLIALQSRPKGLVENQNAVLTSQQVAFQDINAKLLALKGSSASFIQENVFNATSSVSSDETVLTVSSNASAIPGTYNFVVDRLVSTQQLITKGFADQNATPIAPLGATLTFESGAAELTTDTNLKNLNGALGITRGKILITDRSGASATVDLSTAVTANDVLDAINNTAGITVTATVSGDSFKITDTTGSTTATLAVAEVGAGTTAADLGLLTDIDANADTITGAVVNTIGDDTILSTLNDGNGVRFLGNQDDFQVTYGASSFNVNLSSVETLEEVIAAIDTASGGDVIATVNASGTGLLLNDTTSGSSTVTVTALNSSNAAADLGILASSGGGALGGSRVIATLNSKLINNLNGGSGATLGTISITDRSGTADTVDLSAAESIDEVIDLINASTADVTALVNSVGTGIIITDNTGSTASNLIIADVSGTGAADLNIASSVVGTTIDSGNLQLRYVNEATLLSSLNGGKGISSGKFIITDSSGASATVDLSQGNETTIQDVIDEINSRGLAITARVNDNGDGILIEDTGPGTIKLKVEESGSTTAADLGLLGEVTTAGDDLDGSLETTIDIVTGDTLNDVIVKINDSDLRISATVVNDGSTNNPYRLSLIAEDGGKAGAFVFDDGGLDFGTTKLTEARDAVVFYGSPDPASGIAITSTTNTLSNVVPGATIDLVGASDSPVSITINRDDTAITDAAKGFVDNFNQVMDTLGNYDFYDTENEQKGLLFGDFTVSRVRNALYRKVINRNADLTSQFNSLTQIGINIGSGGKLSFDQSKFGQALTNDPDAVEALFTFKETETDEDTNEVTITKAGIGVSIDELLADLTESDGTVQNKLDLIADQIEANKTRIEDLDESLARKRANLEAEFAAMEIALAQLQSQSQSILGLQALAAQSG